MIQYLFMFAVSLFAGGDKEETTPLKKNLASNSSIIQIVPREIWESIYHLSDPETKNNLFLVSSEFYRNLGKGVKDISFKVNRDRIGITEVGRRFPNLNTLKIAQSFLLPFLGINDFNDLTSLKHLQKLDLSHCYGSGFCKLGALTCLSNLNEINLDNCSIIKGDVFQSELYKLTNLTALNLANCKWIASCIYYLSTLTHLRFLNLHGIGIKEQHIEALIPFENLTDLNLFGIGLETDLEMGNDEGINSLKLFTNLQKLNLGASGITNEILKQITLLLPHLKDLSLPYCPEITKEGLVHLSHLTNLKSLDIAKPNDITFEDLKDYLTHPNNLSKIILKNWKCFTEGQEKNTKELEEKFPHIQFEYSKPFHFIPL